MLWGDNKRTRVLPEPWGDWGKLSDLSPFSSRLGWLPMSMQVGQFRTRQNAPTHFLLFSFTSNRCDQHLKSLSRWLSKSILKLVSMQFYSLYVLGGDVTLKCCTRQIVCWWIKNTKVYKSFKMASLGRFIWYISFFCWYSPDLGKCGTRKSEKSKRYENRISSRNHVQALKRVMT